MVGIWFYDNEECAKVVLLLKQLASEAAQPSSLPIEPSAPQQHPLLAAMLAHSVHISTATFPPSIAALSNESLSSTLAINAYPVHVVSNHLARFQIPALHKLTGDNQVVHILLALLVRSSYTSTYR